MSVDKLSTPPAWDGAPPIEKTTQWHWLYEKSSKEVAPWQWAWSENWNGPGCGEWGTDGDYSMEHMARRFKYIGPCIPPQWAKP